MSKIASLFKTLHSPQSLLGFTGTTTTGDRRQPLHLLMKQETEWRNLFKLCLLNINAVYFKGGGGKRQKTPKPKKNIPAKWFCSFFSTLLVFLSYFHLCYFWFLQGHVYFAVQNWSVLVQWKDWTGKKGKKSLYLEQLQQIKIRIKEYLYFLHMRDSNIQQSFTLILSSYLYKPIQNSYKETRALFPQLETSFSLTKQQM